MKTVFQILLVAALVLTAAVVGEERSNASAPAAAERVCPRGSVHAVVGGSHRCLRRGQRCLRRHDRSYHRYRFHCHAGRLTRAGRPGRRPVPAVVMAAGDIACEPGATVTATKCRHRQTATLISRARINALLTLGDNQYEDGSHAEFTGAGAYAATWGRHKAITRPTPGNHEYHLSGASGYFDYFGSAAGERGKGYYSFDLGSWHLIALNSEISSSAGSTQEQWLRADLRATSKPCVLAYWHRPRFSSGYHGSSTRPLALWQALYEARAEVVLNGHDHDYERFAPQNPSGAADANGIRQFVVGTGGASRSSFSSTIAANSQVRDANTFGVLKLTLRSSSYTWQFVPEAGRTFTDTGSTSCH